METKIYNITDVEKDHDKIVEAAEIIRNGGIVAFPTDTVYAIGASIEKVDAIKKLYEVKERPTDNPMNVLVGRDLDMHLCIDIIAPNNQFASRLVEEFWPGPLTIIMPKVIGRVPSEVNGGRTGIGVRMPDDPIALALINEAEVPVVAPSANISGKPSPTTAQAVIDAFDGKIDMILAGPDCKTGIESTVVDLTREYPLVVRPGSITADQIREIIPRKVFEAPGELSL